MPQSALSVSCLISLLKAKRQRESRDNRGIMTDTALTEGNRDKFTDKMVPRQYTIVLLIKVGSGECKAFGSGERREMKNAAKR
jgi:hypothetical protein